MVAFADAAIFKHCVTIAVFIANMLAPTRLWCSQTLIPDRNHRHGPPRIPPNAESRIDRDRHNPHN